MSWDKVKKRAPKFLIMLAVLVVITGCWSRREIEDLGMTIGAAVDIGEETKIEEAFEEQGGDYEKRNVLTLTYQVVLPGQSGGLAVTGGGRKNYKNISVTGDSFYEVTREIPLMRGRPIFGQHYKVIVISDKVAQQVSMKHLFDFFIREQEFRPSCLVLICKGEAKQALDHKDKSDFPSTRLLAMTNNQYRSSRILPPVSLSKLLPEINSSSTFLLQNVITADGEIKFAGAAVIYGKTGKLIGFLKEEELEAVNWLSGKVEGGVVKSYDEDTGQTIVYELTSLKTKIRPHLNKGRISFDIEMDSEGRLGERWNEGDDFDSHSMKQIEKNTIRQMSKRIDELLNKAQKEYRADVIGLSEYVRIYYPRTWEKIKSNWDDVFAEAEIRYQIKAKVKEFGTTSIKVQE
ncbi:Ger(x)C family spore germination protein [Paenibacillus aquistagni]|uniref:Spore germination protein n=1 Tax=Paenibacillus aquistagni TaxID=1852522 RepID=A0A1X7LAR1_9BACL|nr:Ger(x)C family spore germination protein [Paenibacillus aquistagni]SMG50800.1 spore germination protein [Paenibacillus aquistagni]